MSNAKYGLRKIAGHKNRGYLTSIDVEPELSALEQSVGEPLEIPRYTEMHYLRLEDFEE